MEKIQKFIQFFPTYYPEVVKRIFSFAHIRIKSAVLKCVLLLNPPEISKNISEESFQNTDDFLFLPEIYSARKHIFPETILYAVLSGVLTILLLCSAYVFFGVNPFVVISSVVAIFYLLLMLFKLFVVHEALRTPFIQISKEEIAELNDKELPLYTIIIPLYREERVIPQIIEAMSAIDYPPEKLDIIITLEAYDHHTMDAIRAARPPRHFKTLILPDVTPKTKPKALNVAFTKIKGSFLVIYDAEIIPDPDQLKKAYLAFKKHPDVASLQPRLDHYNADRNALTRLFNAEFSFYYDFFLPGLQRFGYPIPLSGHSTHFRSDVVRRVGAWDPYNVKIGRAHV